MINFIPLTKLAKLPGSYEQAFTISFSPVSSLRFDSVGSLALMVDDGSCLISFKISLTPLSKRLYLASCLNLCMSGSPAKSGNLALRFYFLYNKERNTFYD